MATYKQGKGGANILSVTTQYTQYAVLVNERVNRTLSELYSAHLHQRYCPSSTMDKINDAYFPMSLLIVIWTKV